MTKKNLITIYEKYKHLDNVICDERWVTEGNFQYKIMKDLWGEIKQVIKEYEDEYENDEIHRQMLERKEE